MQSDRFSTESPQNEDYQLPAVFSPSSDFKLHELPQHEDQDQLVSQQLLQISAETAADSLLNPFYIASPTTDSESAPADISLSPAAMFLSSFSPMALPQTLPDDEGEIVSGYTLGPMIGRGGTSIIRRASSPQGGVVAVKIVRQADLAKQEEPERARVQLRHEAAVWASLSHEHILPLFSSCHTSYADFFITLYCPAGSLFDILKRDGRPALPQDEAGTMYRQVVKGLRYMHEVAGYVHGDMKLENVMVDDMGVCRIGDFGMAKKIGECESDDEDRPSRTKIIRHATVKQKRSRSRHPLQHVLPSHPSLLRHQSGPRHRNSSPFPTTASPAPRQIFQPGSLPYASPELLIPSTSKAPYRAHPAQDMWALGVMLYVLLTGRLPFADSFEPRLQMKIMNGAFTMPTDIGRGAERVLKGCLEVSVDDRWTVAMVDEVAWGIGWGSVGDETPPPSQLPRSSRARSRARPMAVSEHTMLEHAIVDDDAPRPPSLSAGRSRSRQSRPQHKSFHPYDITTSDNMWDSPIARTSSTSTDSECLSPMEQLEVRTPSSSPDRSRTRSRRIRAISSSRSPLGMHPSPVELIMRDRGRKASPTVRDTLLSAAGNAVSPEPAYDAFSLLSEEVSFGRGQRCLSVDPHDRRTFSRNRSSDKHRTPRDTSLPPRHDLHDPWALPIKGIPGFITPSRRDRLVSPRSRSVDSLNHSIS